MDETAWAQQGYYAVRALDEHVHSDLRPLLRDGAVAGHAHQDPYASYVPLVPGLGAPDADGTRIIAQAGPAATGTGRARRTQKSARRWTNYSASEKCKHESICNLQRQPPAP